MKLRYILLFISLSLFSSQSFSQQIIQSTYFQNNPQLGGDVIINRSIKEIRENKGYTTFEIDAPYEGNYHMSLWMMPTRITDESFSTYDVSINGFEITQKILPQSDGWQSIEMAKENIHLKKGINTISFIATLPEIAEIEFIRLSPELFKSEISSLQYDNYVTKIQEEETLDNTQYKQVYADNVSAYNTANWSGVVLDNPYGVYQHRIGFKFSYTFMRTLAFTTGNYITVHITAASLGAKVAFEMFRVGDPSYRWSATTSASGSAVVSIRNITTGTYMIKLKSLTPGGGCLANLNIQVNGGATYYYPNVVATKSAIEVEVEEKNKLYNIFTCYTTGNPALWIEENNQTTAYNLYANNWGDYNWGDDSRIQHQFTGNSYTLHISSISANEPESVCDVYMNCENTDFSMLFPNLKPVDTFLAAPRSNVYNCYNWIGGIVTGNPIIDEESYFLWPDSEFDDMYEEAAAQLEILDNFLFNKRHSGTPTYTRQGATAENSDIDLWGMADMEGKIYQYTHTSIKKCTDGFPHGYAWESKLGNLERIFHPRYGLNGYVYGEVVAYYRTLEEGNGKTLLECIADGTDVLEHVEFTSTELSIINSKKITLPFTVINNFNTKYNLWITSCKDSPYSNPYLYARNTYYEELLNYCRSYPNLNYLIYEKLGSGSVLTLLLLEDLSLTSNSDNLQKVKKRNKENPTTPDGAFIVRSPYTNAMKYVKSLLEGETYSRSLTTPYNEKEEQEGVRYSNAEQFFINQKYNETEVSFYLQEEASVSLSVFDLNGTHISQLLNKSILEPGHFTYTNNLPSGTYLIKLSVNGNLNVKKIIVK